MIREITYQQARAEGLIDVDFVPFLDRVNNIKWIETWYSCWGHGKWDPFIPVEKRTRRKGSQPKKEPYIFSNLQLDDKIISQIERYPPEFDHLYLILNVFDESKFKTAVDSFLSKYEIKKTIIDVNSQEVTFNGIIRKIEDMLNSEAKYILIEHDVIADPVDIVIYKIDDHDGLYHFELPIIEDAEDKKKILNDFIECLEWLK